LCEFDEIILSTSIYLDGLKSVMVPNPLFSSQNTKHRDAHI